MREIFLILVAGMTCSILDGQVLYRDPLGVSRFGDIREPEGYAGESIKVDVDLVLVPVTVMDRSGHTVRGLTADNFEVLEDGSPQKITHFDAEDAPCSIGLLFDVSRSMEYKISKALFLHAPRV